MLDSPRHHEDVVRVQVDAALGTVLLALALALALALNYYPNRTNARRYRW